MKRKKRRLRKEEISAKLGNFCFDELASVFFGCIYGQYFATFLGHL
jgi:hypothetical protein